jgi:hypothetical protein
MAGANPNVLEYPTWLTRMRAGMRMLAVLAIGGWAAFLVSAGALLWIAFSHGRQNVAVEEPRGVPSLLVSPTIMAEPAATTPLPIQVGPARSIPRDGWVRIVGLPALASLLAEAGPAPYALGVGAWRVPLAALHDLRVRVPEGFARSEISITLMSPQGTALAQVHTVLVPRSDQTIVAWKAPLDARREPFSLELVTVWSRYDARREYQERVKLGDDANFLEGRIAEARQWYEFGAARGWAPAAMALAQTYDPFEIEKRGLALAPDVEKARYWYRKARDLMNASVDFYLWRLDSSPKRPGSPQKRGELLPTRH